MSNNKVKGLLKGLRYISQIFDNEKEPEMQIGLPTDVKHVAHIGWDGPSVNSPSWMNEFQSTPGLSSSPDASVQRDSRGTNQTARDMPELPKSSRRQSSTVGGSAAEAPTREKSEKVGKSKKSSSKSKESSSSESRRSSDVSQGGGESEAPKKARRKKSKEEGSDRSRSKATAAETCSSQFCDNGSDAGSVVGSDDLLTRDRAFT